MQRVIDGALRLFRRIQHVVVVVVVFFEQLLFGLGVRIGVGIVGGWRCHRFDDHGWMICPARNRIAARATTTTAPKQASPKGKIECRMALCVKNESCIGRVVPPSQ